ncbi:hypothetical protein GCM10010289_48160 [Streptomyces violascens]|uniref:Uncharacterized protein n=1 Tax=Streptomyces violascens TaxID=67381 RepID=A0ABQ3QQI6_9ACTN|nr:hypothetical protein GCM10010289_48160 [Streptomyces violascens]GHI39535.1 hypothetical protein Sviol_39430 [Streptomyces violascens]
MSLWTMSGPVTWGMSLPTDGPPGRAGKLPVCRIGGPGGLAYAGVPGAGGEYGGSWMSTG